MVQWVAIVDSIEINKKNDNLSHAIELQIYDPSYKKLIILLSITVHRGYGKIWNR